MGLQPVQSPTVEVGQSSKAEVAAPSLTRKTVALEVAFEELEPRRYFGAGEAFGADLAPFELLLEP